MPETQEAQLVREATDIFLRLRDKPDDKKLRREKERFLERGENERAAYERMLKVWNVTGTSQRHTRAGLSGGRSFIAAGLIVAGGLWAYEPLRIGIIADVSTQFDATTIQLESGDLIALDASTAIANNTDQTERHINLLSGAAFFDVETETRPFIVTAGDLRVEVTGTAFEVVSMNDGGTVAVSEGSVTVRIAAQSWQLVPGDELIWSEKNGAQLNKTDIANAASWREDVLISDGMTLAQITEVLDRRLPGEIVVSSETLAQTQIVGTFDLSTPDQALELLTELTGTRLLKLPYVMHVMLPK